MTTGRSILRRPLSAPLIARLFGRADVTICIPAYQAANFIPRTLHCAQGQTYDRVRILVSVDQSSDETAEICRTLARDDRRIDVFEHDERLGWCGNVNFLLDRVDTPFFFLYFHDDLILPQYCAFLREALLASPEAASANCDVYNFGDREGLVPGHAYEGSVARRLLSLCVPSIRGRPLRSMVRSAKIDADYRLPPDAENHIPPIETLMMRLMAAGPARHVPEALYLRWQRSGSVTDAWQKLPFEQFLKGWTDELARAFPLIDQKLAKRDDRVAVKYFLTLAVMRKFTDRCLAERRPLPVPKRLHPQAPDFNLTLSFDQYGSDIAEEVRKTHAHMMKVRSRLNRKDRAGAKLAADKLLLTMLDDVPTHRSVARVR